MAQTSAVYLYCLLRAAGKPSMTRAPRGLDGAARPRPVKAAGSLWVIAAEVPLAIYGPSRLEPRLRDLEWVAEAAVRHERVVEHFARMRNTTVVPMKLFTMFSSIDKAIADIRARQTTLDRAIRHIAGCEEWGIRVTRSLTTQAMPKTAARRVNSRESGKDGTAFLVARKNARDAAKAVRVKAMTAADDAFERLQRFARDARRRERRSEPGSNPPLLDAAFLVTAASRPRFKAEARRQAAACESAGAEMTLTGPWPAYNFVDGVESRS
jgi:hypothetical protein